MPSKATHPIHIRIDTQEQRSGIPDLLAFMPQMHITMVNLTVGDYDLGGSPARIIERKTASDLILSIQQGRLFEQLDAMQATEFVPILLLEGDPLRVAHSRMTPESIRGALAYIVAILHIPILPSSNAAESAHLLFASARQLQSGYTTPGPATGRRSASRVEQQMAILRALPGIGVVTARALFAHFGSLRDVFSADAATLATVPGITSRRAAALVELLQDTLPKEPTDE